MLCSDFLASLELSAVGSDLWLGVRAWDTWSVSEVLLCLSVLGSSKEKSVSTFIIISQIGKSCTCWCEEHKLIESKNLASGVQDSSSSVLCESQGSHSYLRNLKESDIVSHCSNNHGDSISVQKLDMEHLTSSDRGF